MLVHLPNFMIWAGVITPDANISVAMPVLNE